VKKGGTNCVSIDEEADRGGVREVRKENKQDVGIRVFRQEITS